MSPSTTANASDGRYSLMAARRSENSSPPVRTSNPVGCARYWHLLFHPLQPTEHLAHLSGQFLILEGKDDTLIPQSARARLREAAPAPKTVIAFGGDHMGVGSNKMSLLQAIIAASTTWLIEKGAVNPI